MLKDELISAGLTEEQAKKVFELFGKELNPLKKELQGLTTKVGDAETLLAEREKGIEELKKAGNPEELKKAMADLEVKHMAELAKRDKFISDRDYGDAVNELLTAHKFSSNAAKDAIAGKIKAKGFALENGKILGASDFLEEIRKADPSAFVAEGDEKKPTITMPTKGTVAGTKFIPPNFL